MKPKKVFIVGILGNMGTRYKTICEYLGHEVYGRDKFFPSKFSPTEADCFIIATPTEDHIDDIGEYSSFGKPILCEKPLTKDIEKLEVLEEFLIRNGRKHLVSMVNQYAQLFKGGSGHTYYKYFKSGKDGLAWDCINILGLGRGKVRLSNDSPVWECKINGKKLSLANMDKAYVRMIHHWLRNPKSNFDYAKKAHLKVIEWLKYS